MRGGSRWLVQGMSSGWSEGVRWSGVGGWYCLVHLVYPSCPFVGQTYVPLYSFPKSSCILLAYFLKDQQYGWNVKM